MRPPWRKPSPPEDLATREANLKAQIHIYEALAQALDRRQEVFDVLVSSADAENGRSRLQELLEIDEVSAHAVIDLQLRRLPAGERRRITTGLEELRAHLEEVQRELQN